MKKIMLIIVCMLTISGTQEISAQKWLKKIGKVAEEILATPNSQSSTSKNTSSRKSTSRQVATTVGNATLSNNVSGLDITLRSVERLNATTAKINMVWMNTTSSKMTLCNVNRYGGIYTSDGDELGDAEIHIGSSYNHFLTSASGSFYNAYLPSNVPVKVSVIIKNVPAQTFTFAMIKFSPTNGGWNDYPIEIRNLTVPEQEAQVFKGIWEGTHDSGDYGTTASMIDINLYAKTVENGNGEFCYGTVGQYNPNSGRVLFSYDIVDVKSIEGNTASVVCYDGLIDRTFDAIFTYKPETGTICFDNDLCISRK